MLHNISVVEPWSWRINPDSHTKQVDNSSSGTTVSLTEYLYNGAKRLFLSESQGDSLSKLSTIFVILVMWHKYDQSESEITFFWNSCPARVVVWNFCQGSLQTTTLTLAGNHPSKWTWKTIIVHTCSFISIK